MDDGTKRTRDFADRCFCGGHRVCIYEEIERIRLMNRLFLCMPMILLLAVLLAGCEDMGAAGDSYYKNFRVIKTADPKDILKNGIEHFAGVQIPSDILDAVVPSDLPKVILAKRNDDGAYYMIQTTASVPDSDNIRVRVSACRGFIYRDGSGVKSVSTTNWSWPKENGKQVLVHIISWNGKIYSN